MEQLWWVVAVLSLVWIVIHLMQHTPKKTPQTKQHSKPLPSGYFYTKLVGVTFGNRQAIIARHLREGEPLSLIAELDHPEDSAAVSAYWKDLHVGYLHKELAPKVHLHLIEGRDASALIANITGGTDEHPALGVNLLISLAD